MRIILCFPLLFALSLSACKTSSGSRPLADSEDLCQAPLNLSPYLDPQLACLKKGIWDTYEEEIKRDLALPIPCNQVTWVDQTLDIFGPGEADTEEAIRGSNFFKIFNWLGAKDRFDLSAQADPFADLDAVYATSQDNPILMTSTAQTITQLIQGAKANIFFDIFLLGGSWGVEISRELIKASRRGVKVILIRDEESVFAVGNEIRPLWSKLLEASQREPNFTALAAQIAAPQRVSSVPFGLESLGTRIASVRELDVSAEGRSDHSKILMTDVIFDSNVDEFQGTLRPKVLVSSHNMVDSAASNYYDESVVIEGPAAVAAALHYQSDLFWAWDKAKNQSPSAYNDDDRKLIEDTLTKLEKMRQGPLLVASRGATKVSALQASANDEVRNLDSSIMKAVVEAKSSIDLYGKIIYNWPLAIALKVAMARGVRVRMILDQQAPGSALLNSSFPYMIAQAPRRLANGSTSKQLIDENGREIQEEDLGVRWHLSFRPGYVFDDKNRTNIVQEIHAKTIIIDAERLFFGSTNFDSFTFAGGFREYSVLVESSEIAQKATRAFERIYRHPLLSISHKVWLGKAAVPPEPQAFFARLRSERSEAACPRNKPACDPKTVLQGGSDFHRLAPIRETIRSITEIETKRIKSVTSDDFMRAKDNSVFCDARF